MAKHKRKKMSEAEAIKAYSKMTFDEYGNPVWGPYKRKKKKRK